MTSYNHEFRGLHYKKTYHEETALSLAIACELAYQDKATIIATTPTWGFTEVDFFNVEKGVDIDTQCFVMANASDIVIVFRGSDSKSDWFANFQASQEAGPLSNSKAHEGFQDALFPAVISITNIIDKFNTANKKIWVTGHSLGGALCSLYAGMLIENNYSVYGLYTFASPRPGNANFAKQLNELVKGPHYRVVNSNDIVPHVPPEPFFSHAGKRIILKANKKDRSKRAWLSQRFYALKHFVKITGQAFDVADNHLLVGDDESYLPRLLRDALRNR